VDFRFEKSGEEIIENMSGTVQLSWSLKCGGKREIKELVICWLAAMWDLPMDLS
jgi:hypothetical protein